MRENVINVASRAIRRSVMLGIADAILLAAVLPIWMLAQLGGPEPFWLFAILVILPALLALTWFVRKQTPKVSVLCGLVFSLPISIVCLLMSLTAVSGSGGLERYHEQMRLTAGAVILISEGFTGTMSLRCRRRAAAK